MEYDMSNDYPPLEEGFLRCATVQSEAMLAKLLSDGIFTPKRAEIKPYSMTAECSACEDENQRCWSEAHDWMYKQCSEKLDIPEMDAGLWLYAHDEFEHNFKEAYNYGLEEENMVLLVVDIPKERLVRSDWILFHRVHQDFPIRSSESLLVDCDLPENQYLIERWNDWHNNTELSEQEREKRKEQSWQICFEENRWPDGVYDDAMGNSDASIVQAVTPFITIDDIVDIIFKTDSGMWDFLMKGEILTVYSNFKELSVFAFSRYGFNSRRIGRKSTGAIYGHQIGRTKRLARLGRVHRKKYLYKKRKSKYVKVRSGDNSKTASLELRE